MKASNANKKTNIFFFYTFLQFSKTWLQYKYDRLANTRTNIFFSTIFHFSIAVQLRPAGEWQHCVLQIRKRIFSIFLIIYLQYKYDRLANDSTISNLALRAEESLLTDRSSSSSNYYSLSLSSWASWSSWPLAIMIITISFLIDQVLLQCLEQTKNTRIMIFLITIIIIMILFLVIITIIILIIIKISISISSIILIIMLIIINWSGLGARLGTNTLRCWPVQRSSSM